MKRKILYQSIILIINTIIVLALYDNFLPTKAFVVTCPSCIHSSSRCIMETTTSVSSVYLSKALGTTKKYQYRSAYSICKIRKNRYIRSSIVKSQNLNKEVNMEENENYDLISDDDMESLLQSTDRGITISPSEKKRVTDWINQKEAKQMYPLCYPLSGTSINTALEDPLLPGLYDVAYVGSSQTQETKYGGNPAGGQYRSKIARMFYQTEGVYQHILNEESLFSESSKEKSDANKYQYKTFLESKINRNLPSKDVIVINYISGLLFNLIYLNVVLYGRVNQTEQQECLSLKQKFGTDLSPSTITAYFAPPLLGIGLKYFRDKLFRIQLGPVSSVVLDTPYLSSRFRLGKGSRGSLFIFKRVSDNLEMVQARGYEAVLSKVPIQGKTVGVALIMLSLTSIFTFTLKLTSRLSKITPALLFLSGFVLLFTRGGIERDFDHAGKQI